MPVGDGVDAATPDFGEIGAGEQCQGNRRRQPGRDIHTEQGDTEKHQEQLHQQRRALEQFDIGACKVAREGFAADAHRHHQQTDHTAADKGHQ